MIAPNPQATTPLSAKAGSNANQGETPACVVKIALV